MHICTPWIKPQTKGPTPPNRPRSKNILCRFKFNFCLKGPPPCDSSPPLLKKDRTAESLDLHLLYYTRQIPSLKGVRYVGCSFFWPAYKVFRVAPPRASALYGRPTKLHAHQESM